MKPLWLRDIMAWQQTPLKDRLEALRLFYCTGPCGQSSSVSSTRQVTDEALKEAIMTMDSLNEVLRQRLEDEEERRDRPHWYP